jgi:hypothetical protein
MAGAVDGSFPFDDGVDSKESDGVALLNNDWTFAFVCVVVTGGGGALSMTEVLYPRASCFDFLPFFFPIFWLMLLLMLMLMLMLMLLLLLLMLLRLDYKWMLMLNVKETDASI